MKIAGIDPSTLPNEEILVLPRGEQNIVFKARAVEDMDTFRKLCPEPTPPGKLTKDGWVPDEQDESFQSIKAEHNKRWLGYLVVMSLEASAIEWDTVKLDNPSTWANWQDDLRKAGFSQVECNRVFKLVLEANCLDESKLEKARKLFLLGLPKAEPA